MNSHDLSELQTKRIRYYFLGSSYFYEFFILGLNTGARCGKLFKDNNIVFCSKVGTYVYPENLRRSMRIVLKKAGLKRKARLHMLRHTYTKD